MIGLASLFALITLVGASTAVAGWSAWSSPLLSPGDRLALVSLVLTASTVALAVVGSLVALAAYAAATQRPDLEVSVEFRFSFPNEPVLELSPVDPSGTGSRQVAPWRQTEATVKIRNRSSYSARNPALQIQLLGLGGIPGQTGWAPMHFVNTVGPTAVQWEGGADYAIHGNWERELPVLNFAGVRSFDGRSGELVCDLVADGFPQHHTHPGQAARG